MVATFPNLTDNRRRMRQRNKSFGKTRAEMKSGRRTCSVVTARTARDRPKSATHGHDRFQTFVFLAPAEQLNTGFHSSVQCSARSPTGAVSRSRVFTTKYPRTENIAQVTGRCVRRVGTPFDCFEVFRPVNRRKVCFSFSRDPRRWNEYDCCKCKVQRGWFTSQK